MKLDLSKLSLKEKNQGTQPEQTFKLQNEDELRDVLKKIRKKKKVTQEEIAIFSNLSRLAVNEFETGKSDIHLSTFFKLLKAYGVTLELKE